MRKVIRILAAVMAGITIAGVMAGIKDLEQQRQSKHKPYGIYEKYFKRPLDLISSVIALIVLSPVMAATAVFVRVKLGKPVLFKQQRPGKDGKVFTLLKYRSMAELRGDDGELLPDKERLGSFGKSLRSSSLDELPELFNIVKGDMSIIGPRPLLVRYLPRYNRRQATRHDVRPGLTGLAQVGGRNMISWDDKLEDDAKYVEKITFWNDVKILLKTVSVVLKHDDIGVEIEEFIGSKEAGQK